MRLHLFLLSLLSAAVLPAATIGTSVAVTGSATDIVLDDGRGRLYLVNSTQNRVDVYAIAQRRYLNSIPTSGQPLGAAMSRNGALLYVTAYDGSSLEVIDLERLALASRVSLPAAPVGVAVGGDERVLITTIGSGTNNADNRILLYDPFLGTTRAIASSLPAPTAPVTPAAGRAFLTSRSQLSTSADGNTIIGLTNPTTTSREVFVYEVASASILRSRTVTNISNVLSVAPDGSRFMAGLSLFDAATLAIDAQQNAANSMYPFPNNVNFNTQNNQGGSVFSPDGVIMYSAFNFGPLNSTTINSSQLMLNDSQNLLIQLGLQLPENLTGKMVISADGGTIYALSQSGFLTIPVSTIYDNPVAVVDQPAVLVSTDQCGVFANQKKYEVRVRNAGKGRITATAAVITTGPTITFPLGGAPGGGGAANPIGGGGIGGGPGGGAPGGVFPIVLPGGGGVVQIPPGVIPGGGAAPGGVANTITQQTGVTASAPAVVRRTDGNDTVFEITVNSATGKSIGTVTPIDFQISATEAINIPARVRVYQNSRNSESRGDVYTVPISVSTAEGLADLVQDTVRQKLYIANSGLNRVEVFDTRLKQFIEPIKVGQLPRSLAMTPNGRFLYVANTGGESISIIDLDAGRMTGKVRFPPTSYNASFAVITPSVIAAGMNGVEMVMSSGALWSIVNDVALPRPTSKIIGTTTIQTPRTLVATPGGEYMILVGGNGVAYLYDAMSDDYVLSQQVTSTTIQGYFGAVTAGPRGQYFVVNGQVLNSALTPLTFTQAAFPGGGAFPAPFAVGANANNASRVSAVAAVSANMLARFVQPTRASATATITDSPTVELIDATTGATRGTTTVLEGPLATQVGTQRVNVSGNTMSVSSDGTTAYMITASGLTVAPITLATALPGGGGAIPIGPGTGTPVITVPAGVTFVNPNGVVNPANNQTKIAPGVLVTINGQNLGSDAEVSASGKLPTILGGTCVTLNNEPIPLMRTTSGAITAQIPNTLKEGRYPLVARSIERGNASIAQTITVSKVAPAPFVADDSGQVMLYRADGGAVTKSNKAKRDEPLILFASGLGATAGKVTTGEPAPAGATATEKVQVYFGDIRYKEAEIIVDWVGLSPGVIGVYQINLRVPGAHMKGDALPVTIRAGGVDSPTTGSIKPIVAVE